MAEFQMPAVKIGDPICWHVDAAPGEDHAHAAFVTAVHPFHIDLVVFIPGRNPTVRSSVRHIDDPKLKDIDKRFRLDAGGWDFSPFHKRINDLEAAFKDSKRTSGKA